MKILVVEDEEKGARFLHQGLIENGYIVDLAHRGDEALHLIQIGDYDLVILDIMLPGGDGLSVVRELRRSHVQIPVLMLSARDAVADRVRGLEMGGDDYLVKPFEFSELVARVRSLLRRSSPLRPEILTIGDLEVDVPGFRALRAGQRLDLTPKEFQLLLLMAQRRGQVVSRTTMLEKVWEMHLCPDSNVVDVHIRRLRQKVDDAYDRKLIHTVRGAGYVLEAR